MSTKPTLQSERDCVRKPSPPRCLLRIGWGEGGRRPDEVSGGEGGRDHQLSTMHSQLARVRCRPLCLLDPSTLPNAFRHPIKHHSSRITLPQFPRLSAPKISHPRFLKPNDFFRERLTAKHHACQQRTSLTFCLPIPHFSHFEFVSDFDIRISDLPFEPAHHLGRPHKRHQRFGCCAVDQA